MKDHIVCPKCNGTGLINDEMCKKCLGTGVVGIEESDSTIIKDQYYVREVT